jgi:hypothetical protein
MSHDNAAAKRGFSQAAEAERSEYLHRPVPVTEKRFRLIPDYSQSRYTAVSLTHCWIRSRSLRCWGRV